MKPAVEESNKRQSERLSTEKSEIVKKKEEKESMKEETITPPNR